MSKMTAGMLALTMFNGGMTVYALGNVFCYWGNSPHCEPKESKAKSPAAGVVPAPSAEKQ